MDNEINSELPFEDLELIDRYLTGDLNEQELEAFQIRMEKESQFKAEVRQMRSLVDAVEVGSLTEKMQEFHEGLPSSQQIFKQPVTRTIWARYAVAASVALIAAFSSWLYLKQDPHQKIFNNYFEADPGLITPMSSQADYPFYEGMVSYKREDYHKAISIWNNILTEKPDNDTLNFYLGVSHLALGDEATALDYLRTASARTDGVFIQEIHHFIGLAELKNGQTKAAISAFQKSGLDESQAVLEALIP